ncbi:hypothetical protein LPJ66_004104 [Kickxella alabastrina]|uniref:Uncharacterized protein n=1 Tax=Kickxella alabastrina TaxID=61397 RepID=A0ACC1IJM1_9FUNG|nr:hypothetical protein LPJ66_004104 [Kickxella alabastrina]
MRAEGLLQQSPGNRRTAHVIQDTAVALQLARAIAQHGVWEECLALVNLLTELQLDILGVQLTDRRFARTGRAAKHVSGHVVRALVAAVLAPQFAGPLDRRLAGLTAKQVLADYAGAGSGSGSGLRQLRLRAEGFVSRGRALARLAKADDMRALSATEAGELALAHARCLDLESAQAQLARSLDLGPAQAQLARSLDLGPAQAQLARSLDLGPAQAQLAQCGARDEALAALALCLAEHGRLGEAQDAIAQMERGGVTVWSARARLWVVQASALAVTPRLAFSAAYHSPASAHLSRPYARGFRQLVRRLMDESAARIEQAFAAPAERERLGVDRLLFAAGCAVHAMGGADQTHPGALAAALHVQLAAAARRIMRSGTDAESPGARALALGARQPLRLFLWAALFGSSLGAAAKRRLMLDALRHASASVPGFAPGVAELEPALVCALPPGVWAQARRGNFADDAAFDVPDALLASPERHAAGPDADAIRDWALRASLAPLADARLVVLAAWLAALRGDGDQALALAQRAAVAPVSLVPGALALAKAQTPETRTSLLTALSTFKRGADAAVAHTAPRAHMGPAEACALLRCCATSRNAAVARDIHRMVPGSRKADELYLRACVRAGQVALALPLFRRLAYGAPTSWPADPTVAVVLAHLADARVSVAGAEHVFGVWVEAADFHGRASPALLAQVAAAGWTREAGHVANAFAPEPRGATVSQALEAAGAVRAPSGANASVRFLRVWELHMVVLLVCAYVQAGLGDRAARWEAWLLACVADGRVPLSPEIVARLGSAQRRHLARRSEDGLRACLRYLVAADRAAAYRLLDDPAMRRNAMPALSLLSQRLVRSGREAELARSYLRDLGAEYLYGRIIDLQ